jgi:glucose-6-phosphate 1-dehydrogenase
LATIIPVASFDCVVFGATGDLTTRKLLPALYHRFRDGQIPGTSRIIGASRSELSVEAFRERARDSVRRFVAASDIDEGKLAAFLEHLDYVAVDGAGEEGWEDLAAKLAERPDQVRPYYLATSPDLYGAICRNLSAHGLIGEKSRVVLEKPIGKDLRSARAINDAVGEVFPEEQIFRIDHYLGKETVQNLLALRFANTIFERLWTADVIDHVQITVGETVGVEGRAGYYDTSGALRDMVQNHMLQLLCLMAMESPLSLDANSVRDEKLKVLRALKPSHRTTSRPSRCGASTRRAPSTGSPSRATAPTSAAAPTAAPRPSWRSSSKCSPGAGPACRSTFAPASDCPRSSPRSWCSSGPRPSRSSPPNPSGASRTASSSGCSRRRA